MHHPTFQSQRQRAGITRREVVLLLFLAGMVGSLGLMYFYPPVRSGTINKQLQSGRSIYIAMRNYAAEHDGQFPLYKQDGGKAELVVDSNEAFEELLGRYLDSKRYFGNISSAYHRTQARTDANKNQVLAGESDWAYVRGLGRKSDFVWPLLATAFAPGTTTYVNDRTKLGGVWGGKSAVIVYVSGAAEIVSTQEGAGGPFVERKDKSGANMFERDGAWLAGEKVKVLNPKE